MDIALFDCISRDLDTRIPREAAKVAWGIKKRICLHLKRRTYGTGESYEPVQMGPLLLEILQDVPL